ncbi:MAG: cyclic beta,2-glucan modification transrane protein [Paenibacillaceae bacterium]|jgi:phosphoglycerol transferase MdoB-like AlkP superfamily enzyme|nr:cyclic beta,2-glucan modification transrane protein [Paenibacillaceae bacterium]
MIKNGLFATGRYLRSRYVLFLLGAWLVFLMEFLSRSSATDAMKWTYQHIPAFLFNMVLLTGLLLLFTAITGRTRLAYWIVFTLAFILSLISGIKLKILGVPLLPMDFVLTSETEDMTQYLNNIVNPKTLIGILVYIGASVGLLYFIPDMIKKIKGKERIAFVGAAVFFVALVYYQPTAMMQGVFGIEEKSWNQKDNILSNGLLLCTLRNLDNMNVTEVKGYDEASIAAIVSRPVDPVVAGEAAAAVKPNIIIVLGEAFWDPTVIPGVKFSEDPIPGFHKLAEKYPSGWLLSPQYGGGTANVEFEVLTGNSMRFMPQGSTPYNQYFTHEVDSLASIAARQGYTPTAINPFHNWFFNSREVYKNMGFSKFISIEFFDQVFQGPYIADDEVANLVIKSSTESEGPDLIFTNTMENHFHFWPGKFKENTFKVQGVEGQAKGLLETLAQGINGTDKMLLKLVDHYSKSGEPTIIAFFGDHLPSLGDEYKGFIDSKYITGTDDPEFWTKMYKTPFVVWNNFLEEEKEDLYMSPSFLGPYILEKAKLKGTYYTDYLKELYKKVPVIPTKDHYADLAIHEEDLKDYEKLQYDIMFGERHGYAEFKDQILAKEFVLGLGVMDIAGIDTEPDAAHDKKITVTINGRNFPQLSVVTVNGKPVETRYVSHDKLTAVVPGELNKTGEVLTFTVQVIDSKTTVIAETPEFKLQR